MKLCMLFLAGSATLATSFLLPQHSTTVSLKQLQSFETQTLQLAQNLEFSVVEEEDASDKESSSDYSAAVNSEESESPVSSSSPTKSFPQYAALAPGTATTLQIQVGDLALARKAWKKRRRSGSPLLVPCSVLNMDRVSMLRGNMMFLLYKFGTPQKDGVVLSLADLKRRFTSHLKSTLMDHVKALGYNTVKEFVEAMFGGKAIQDSYGVRLIYDESKSLFLKSPLSKYRALQKAAQSTLLQVVAEDDENASDTMKHTGHIRVKNEGEGSDRPYFFPPLSAAIRVSQKEDVDSGNIQEGSIHPAVFFDYDDQGDGGSPLLTLSLNPARRPTTKKRAKANSGGKVHPKYFPMRNPRHMVGDLQVGAGPFEAKVVRLVKEHAVVDFGVGRKFSQQSAANNDIGSPEFVKVYGTLRFKDAIDPASTMDYYDGNPEESSPSTNDEVDVFAPMEEMLNKVDALDDLEDGEEAEDITDMFSLNEDGSLAYSNPETGETEIVDNAGDEEDAEEEEEDQPVTFDMSSHLKRLRKPRTKRLRVGDLLHVHILSVSKQSSQFTVTTDPSIVRGKKAKDIKKEGDVTKKLERLSNMLGGLEKAEELKGREYDGTVKATSRTGDWLYVQPNTSGEADISLPVGVATIHEELAADCESSSFAQGDLVRIQLDGIDESRGQLAMRVIEKLSP